VGLRVGLDYMKTRKLFSLAGNRTPISRSSMLPHVVIVVHHHTISLRYTG
jgi:hypothetical protein